MGKRLVCVAKGQLAWETYDEVAPGEGQVLIQVEHAAAKHGTEMSMFKGYGFPRGPYDRELGLHRPEQASEGPTRAVPVGNMVVGTVSAVGENVSEVKVGDRVATYSGFRQTVVASEGRCWVMPEGMPWQSAVCLDPAEFAFAAVRDGHVRVGDAVAVFGLGAIGLMAVQIAALAGAYPVIAIDPLAKRCDIAAQVGATLTLDPTACDAGLEIKLATQKRGADVVIDYSGARSAMQHALRGVAYGGTVVAGAYPPPYGAGLDFGAEAHLNIPRIVFSRACSQPDRDHPRWDEPRIFDTCWRLLGSGALTGVPIVDPVVPFDTLGEEYPKIATSPDEMVKLGADL